MPVPDFSPGEVLTASAMDSIGLWLIKTDTITSGSSKEITNIFSSSYRNYLIVVDNLELSAGSILRLRMGTNALNYYAGGVISTYAAGTVSGEFVNNGSEWVVGPVADSSGKASGTINVFQPNQTVRTGFSAVGIDSRVGGAGTRSYSGFLNNTTAYTSATFLVTGATFTTCNIAVYGYRN